MDIYKDKDYYIGLDIGTNSVGWAVTDEKYNILKANKKWMHGVRMFEAMQTAEQRRAFRTSRRRYKRRKDRLNQLKSYFEDELKKVDPEFLIRMEEGFLQEPERSVERNFTFFNDDNYTDVDYYKQYPTIYHLRRELVVGNIPDDIRLVYLALHHIMKYRGHFLFHGKLDMQANIEGLLEELNDNVKAMFDKPAYDFDGPSETQSFLNILTDKKINKTRRTGLIKGFQNKSIDKKENQFEEIHKLLSARKVNLGKLFINSEFEEKIDVQLDDANIEEKMEQLSQLNDEEFRIIEIAKSIYDWSLLQNILGDNKTISDAMVMSYEKHKWELDELKEIVKSIGKNEYKEIFSDKPVKGKPSLYQAYVDSGTGGIDSLYNGIKKILDKAPDKHEKEVALIREKIENKDYLLKQRIPTNGVIPHQLHLYELRSILKNAEKKFSFLIEKDDTGLSKSKQIVEIFKFRIPYYVGPLNDAHKETGFAWVIRKEQGKVYPWNFNDKIDEERTAEAFINRMTNKCSYLLEESVLPKTSIIYQKFMVLNAINNLRFNDIAISSDIKQRIYEDLFVRRSDSITKAKIEKWARANLPEYFDGDFDIKGIDNVVNASLSSMHTLNNIFGDSIPDEKTCEELIYWSTIFNEEKHILKERISKAYPGRFSNEELNKFIKVNFVGWGRLSRKLLENFVDPKLTGEPISIIQALYYENKNFMELLSKEYSYSSQIEEYNAEILASKSNVINYEMLDGLNMPPNIKRSVWQTIRITEEIKKIAKKDPARIFVEVAREDGLKKRTSSRKDQLKAFYKSLDLDPLLKENLEHETDGKLSQRKVYLYYKQLGRCMYSGESIDFSKLITGSDYDLDHIYPRSKTDDDSLTNLVLVKKETNQFKSDRYPLPREIQNRQRGFWYQLREAGLIEKEKYYRLTRTTPLTIDELANFVARQLVETRQSTKAVMDILKQIYPNSKVVTIKAQHLDKFRRDNDFIKVRSLNDFHHARDAYLAIVVGNAYYSKFTDSPRIYIKNARHREYNLAKIIDSKEPGKYITDSNGLIAWESGVNGTIKTVNEMMSNNQILTTYMIQERTGALFDQNPISASKNKVPLKEGLSTERYGGYNKAAYEYYVLVEEIKKNKAQRILVPIPIYRANQFKEEGDLEKYLKEGLGITGRLILKKIPANNALFEIDGIRGRITGVSGNKYVLRNEYQPHFNNKDTQTLKQIDKIKTQSRTDLLDKINEKDLLSVYDAIIGKMYLKLYAKRLSAFRELAITNRDRVIRSSKQEKMDIIWELLKLIKSGRELSNLVLLGGASQAGVNTVGRNLSNKESVNLIHQSVTGIYEQKIDLLRI